MPKPKRFLLTLSLVAALTQSKAQRFYVTDGPSLIKLNPNGSCQATKLLSCGNALSIALDGDTLYYNIQNRLYKALRRNNGFTNCSEIDTIAPGTTALTVSNDNLLYYASGNRLYQTNPRTRTKRFLGAMPYVSAGDMVFFNGKLFLASIAGVVEINLSDPGLSTLVVPYANRNMYGLAVLALDCNKNGLFAFVSRGNETSILEIDLGNGTLSTPLCVLPYGVLDAASLVENGEPVGIVIDQIAIIPLCEKLGKARVEINTESGLIPFTYTLSNGAQNTTGIFRDLDAGNYRLAVTTPGGCRKDTAFTVPAYVQPTGAFTAHREEPTCATPGRVRFTSSPSSSSYRVVFENDTFSVQHQFTGLSFGEHRFVFVNRQGCVVDSARVHFAGLANCDTIYFPSAFTPNQDGKNDVFRGSYNWGLSDFDLRIYNRWGQPVFATSAQGQGWNGNRNGSPQPSAVYVWVARYKTTSGIAKWQKGTVVLIR